MSVAIVDYGMGNLGSVYRAFQECGAESFISNNPVKIMSADHIVMPGVGAFSEGMRRLQSDGLVEPLRKAALEMRTPFLGICLGMQLLADKGYEGGETEGLKLVPGVVQRFIPDMPSTRIPHIGWNQVKWEVDSPIKKNLPDEHDFYFVHSYHFVTKDTKYIVATTPYCGRFVSVVAHGNVFGTQFHPEKSSKVGFRVIRNFLSL